MAPITFQLVLLNDKHTESYFLSTLRRLGAPDRPLFVGKCQHWVHAPHMSAAALIGAGPEIQKWDFLVVTRASSMGSLAFSNGLMSCVVKIWSLTADVDEVTWLSTYASAQRTRLSTPSPPLPAGWSKDNHSGLDTAIPPSDLEASLALAAYPLGSRTDAGDEPVVLKDFIKVFGSKYGGAVSMLNLLAYQANQRPRYFEYIAAFSASVGSKYGGEAMILGSDIKTWSSKEEEVGQSGWEDAGLVHYPSIWHFAKMLDDPGYMDVDRRFKQGVLRDNPIMCCTEIELDYRD